MKHYCLALPISLLVFASSATPQAPSSSVPLISREDAYRLFISDVGIGELNMARAIRRDELPLPERRKFSECLALRKDADEIIYPILTGAFQEIQTAEQVVNNAVGARRQLSQEEAAQLVPVFVARDRKEAATLKETLALLQEKLGDTDFAKLDSYIFEVENGGMPWTTLMPRKRLLDKCNPSAYSAPKAVASRTVARADGQAPQPSSTQSSVASQVHLDVTGHAALNEGDTYGQGPGTSSSQSSPRIEAPTDERAHIALTKGYQEFIFGQGSADEQYFAAINAGKTPLVPRFSYAKFTHTSEEEEETIRSIIAAAYTAMRSNDTEHENEINALQAEPYSPERDTRMKLCFDQREQNLRNIVERAMTQLKDVLTEEDFRRLDWYVRTLERIGK